MVPFRGSAALDARDRAVVRCFEVIGTSASVREELAVRARLLGGILVALVVASVGLAARSVSTVTFVDDGEVRTVRTFASTVAEALDRAGIVLGPADEVDPAPTAAIITHDVVTVRRAVPVTFVLDGEAQDVLAVLATVDDVLAHVGVEDPGPAALRIEPPRGTVLQTGLRIEAEHAIPVTVVADGSARRLLTFAPDIAGVLTEAGVALGVEDRVHPPVDAEVTGPLTIGVQRVTRVTRDETVLIPPDEERRSSEEYVVGVTRVLTAGEPGLSRRTVELTLVDGLVADLLVVDEEVVAPPVTAVVVEGTYVPPPPGTGGGRVVHLTFDDGPNPQDTPAVLDLLARYDAQAVFFVIGNAVAAHPELTRRIVAEGHRLGNHTWSHPSLAGRSRGFVEDQLLRAQRAVADAAGVRPTCMRPPYGASDGNVVRTSEELGLRVVRWSVDPFDWRDRGPGTIAAAVLADTGPGSIVLLHDGPQDRGQTVAALATILAELSDRGYRFTAVPGC